MSFNPRLYPRRIKIERADHQNGEAKVSYGGMTPEEFSLVLDNVPCNVQSKSSGRSNTANLPADTVVAQWQINIPRDTVADGVIKKRDIITDDLGRRFSVVADHCHPLGWKLLCDEARL
jgi:hypothetical protein